jgi:hypothetical protein
MTKSKTFDMQKYIEDEYKKIHKMEDIAMQFPTNSDLRKSTMKIVDMMKRGLLQTTSMLHNMVRKEYPDVNITDNYDLFNKFKFTVVITELDVPKIKF